MSEAVVCPNCGKEVRAPKWVCSCGWNPLSNNMFKNGMFGAYVQLGVSVLLIVGVIAMIAWALWPSARSREVRGASTDYSLWVAKAQEDVKARLKDPSTAEFRNVRVSESSGAPLVCGEVNSNNSFGGKGGYQRFIFGGTQGLFFEEQMAAGEMDKAWPLLCR